MHHGYPFRRYTKRKLLIRRRRSSVAEWKLLICHIEVSPGDFVPIGHHQHPMYASCIIICAQYMTGKIYITAKKAYEL